MEAMRLEMGMPPNPDPRPLYEGPHEEADLDAARSVLLAALPAPSHGVPLIIPDGWMPLRRPHGRLLPSPDVREREQSGANEEEEVEREEDGDLV